VADPATEPAAVELLPEADEHQPEGALLRPEKAAPSEFPFLG
jgi:hypothetical protein